MRLLATTILTAALALVAVAPATAADDCEGYVDRYGDCVVEINWYPGAGAAKPCPRGYVYDHDHGAGACVDPTPRRWRGRYCGDVDTSTSTGEWDATIEVRVKGASCAVARRLARAAGRGYARWGGFRATFLRDNARNLDWMDDVYVQDCSGYPTFDRCASGPAEWDYRATFRRGRVTVKLRGYLDDGWGW